MAPLLFAPCWGQGAAPSASDATFKEIVLLESAAAKASEERRYPAAIDDHSRALQLAEQLQRPRLVAVLLVRLGQDYEDDNEIQRGLVSNEMAFKALQRDPSLDLSLVIRRLGTASKGFSRAAGSDTGRSLSGVGCARSGNGRTRSDLARPRSDQYRQRLFPPAAGGACVAIL